MVYKIVLTTDEIPGFKRTLIVNPDINFLELHKCILSSVGYNDDQMTSFFMCNENWEKGQEVTLVEMDKSFEYDNMTMDTTLIRDLLTEKGQRFIYVFDQLYERYFYGLVNDILPENIKNAKCVEKKGNAPKQQLDENNNFPTLNNQPVTDLDNDEFFNSDKFDEEDIDDESFQNLSFEDGTMF